MKAMSRMHLCVIMLVVFPACHHGNKACRSSEKKQGRRVQSGGSVFTPISEDSVRQQVREYHANESATQEGPERCEVSSLVNKRLSRKQKIENAYKRAQELEARASDIPRPLNAEPIVDFFEEPDTSRCAEMVFGYSSSLSSQEVMDFYRQEMERVGWNCLSDVRGTESIASFKKPDRLCSITARQAGSRSRSGSGATQITIFTGPVSGGC